MTKPQRSRKERALKRLTDQIQGLQSRKPSPEFAEVHTKWIERIRTEIRNLECQGIKLPQT